MKEFSFNKSVFLRKTQIYVSKIKLPLKFIKFSFVAGM